MLTFADPDGMRFALVGVAGAENEPAWSGGDIPAEHAIRGFHGVTLLLGKAASDRAILTGVLGFREVGARGRAARASSPATCSAAIVDLREAGDFPRGRLGRGSVHHVAFRAADDAAQAAMAQRLVADHGMQVTEQKDRNYFRSVYFREPGGVLFEIATDDPGFAVDEPAETLGQALKLPRFLEPRRAEIEAKLPPLGERGGVMANVLDRRRAAASARAAAIMVHGRGAQRRGHPLARRGVRPGRHRVSGAAGGRARLVSVFVPRAAGAERAASGQRARAPSARRSSIWRSEGFAPERVALIGFSQGGCLALEYAARNAQRYGAVAGLSAGLIGPPGTPRDYAGSLAGTPVFLGCSDVDGHIPLARVHEIARRAHPDGRRGDRADLSAAWATR